MEEIKIVQITLSEKEVIVIFDRDEEKSIQKVFKCDLRDSLLFENIANEAKKLIENDDSSF